MRTVPPPGTVLLAVLAAPAVSLAQGDPAPSDFAVPSYVSLQAADEEAATDQEEVDLANIVQTAAKAITTVQEAPAIVTVIPDEEIRDRGFHRTLDLFDGVPGWMGVGVFHSQFEYPITRGTPQAMLLLRDGVSLYDPSVNIPQFAHIIPLETIKRVELVTGPGGVLWGANSYLGIVSITTLDADDVDGIEVGLSSTGGDGERGALKTYAMLGVPEILSRRIKLFLHGSFETYAGPRFELPQLYLTSLLPNPRGPTTYGPLTASDAGRSYMANLDGKLTVGDFKLSVSAPWGRRYYSVGGLTGRVVLQDLPEDGATDPMTGESLCPSDAPVDDPADACYDKGRFSRQHAYYWYDRYVVGDYKKRTAGGRFGANLKAYGVEFGRDVRASNAFSPQAILEGGAQIRSNLGSYRAGTQADFDTRLGDSVQLLFGGETFYEWLPDRTTDGGSRQGPGTQATFLGPSDLTRLPLNCPVQPDGMGGTEFVPSCPTTNLFQTDRTTMAAYGDLQWRLAETFSVDGGARFQVAPGSLGNLSYDPETLFSGAAVWNFARDWYLKVNYAEGFRAPVFNNTRTNLNSTNVGGDPDISVERSQALQGEVNARLYRGEGALRELDVRGDYSYTILSDLIQVIGARYQNTGERGLNSAEFLAKAYLKGGHRLELAYTWLRVAGDDYGVFRSLPEHWFHVGTVFDVVEDKLSMWTRLRVIGSMEDPNQIVEYRDLAYDELGRPLRRGHRRDGRHQRRVARRGVRPPPGQRPAVRRLPVLAAAQGRDRGGRAQRLQRARLSPGRLLRPRAPDRAAGDGQRGLLADPVGHVPLLNASG